MMCPNCRNIVPENNNTCIYCGYIFESGEAETWSVYEKRRYSSRSSDGATLYAAKGASKKRYSSASADNHLEYRRRRRYESRGDGILFPIMLIIVAAILVEIILFLLV